MRAMLAAVCIGAAAIWAGGASGAEPPPPPDQVIAAEAAGRLPASPFYHVAPDDVKGGPGALIRSEPVTDYTLPPGVTAVRFVYLAGMTPASGVVLVPPGTPPAGGWPVIAWAHGTTGVARICAPSEARDLASPSPAAMAAAGYAVVAPDYVGLGPEGRHAYLNKPSHARDIVNALPAARAAVASLGRKWVVDGHSQGGLAAWGAAEMAKDDPDFLGAVVVSGATDLAALSDLEAHPGGAALLPYLAFGIKVRLPLFKVGDMIREPALERFAIVTSKGCLALDAATFGPLPWRSFIKPGWTKSPMVQQYFSESTVGEDPVDRPMLVIAGGGDNIVPIAVTKAVVAKACTHHLPIEFRAYPALDHVQSMDQTLKEQLAWIADRFAGKPGKSTCEAKAP
ncbi:MAG TPA: lipase family protein [Stellaceae bacterium]|nr:lipase family protein [Stellaceae bacterium]